jgi:type II secretory pathway pseudopilin PulG
MTLVEILVVMSVMIILVSAVVVAVFRISSKAPVEGTKGLLNKLAVGLESYRATYRMYPPVDPNDPFSPLAITPPSPVSAQVQASSGALWKALEYNGQGQFMSPVSAAYKAPGGTFTDPTTGAIQTWYYYQDAWQQPLCYVCQGPSYTQYTLTSGGPDLILFTADDIVKP